MTIIQYRNGTAAAWTSADPVLADGEPGLETDTRKLKHGNGVDTWTEITEYSDEGIAGDPGADGTDGVHLFLRALGDPLPVGIAVGDEIFRPE